jgi:Ca2+-transporting ATPase
MEKACHSLRGEGLARGGQPGTTRTLLWQFGLQPDLLAVTNVWDESGHDQYLVAAKGAPEAIAGLCGLAAQTHAKLRDVVDDMAGRGLRVLAVARAAAARGSEKPRSPRGFRFEFLGLVASPIRCVVAYLKRLASAAPPVSRWL